MSDQTKNRRVFFAALVSAFSVIWSLSAAGVALVEAGTSGSPSLIGFGLAALIDAAASVILVWHFGSWVRNPVRAERLEKVAMRTVGAVLILAGAYVVFRSVSQLREGTNEPSSSAGVAITAVSVAVLPWVAAIKLRLAGRIPSVALRADGVLTAGAATLAAVTLVAIAIDGTRALWWLDPIVALAIACTLAVEGTRTLRAEAA